MKNLELQDVCLKELAPEEQLEINGGSFGLEVLGGLLLAIAKEVLSDWENFKRGLAGQPEILKK